MPPDLSAEEDREKLKLQEEYAKERERKVRFTEQPEFDDDEDYAPVEIPESMLSVHEPTIPPPQTLYMRGGVNEADFHQSYSLQAAQQQRFFQSSIFLIFLCIIF